MNIIKWDQLSIEEQNQIDKKYKMIHEYEVSFRRFTYQKTPSLLFMFVFCHGNITADLIENTLELINDLDFEISKNVILHHSIKDQDNVKDMINGICFQAAIQV